MNVADLSGEHLEYWMYQHACKVLSKTGSKDEFEKGYANGQFHFATDKALLGDLMETYNINIQRLAGEWLASTAGNSFYGDTPLMAACRLVVALTYGKSVDG